MVSAMSARNAGEFKIGGNLHKSPGVWHDAPNRLGHLGASEKSR
jgi:hypothetical protein